ncbi:MAG TPA: DUF3667 domain-containing protein [Rhizomicrobium sp.]|jgi:hypothetical protein|nr:DUF3667 domain-containing protein [Rhizomicrobium sp.]
MPDQTGAIAELGGAAAIEIAASALATHGAPPEECRNCSTPMPGAYCGTCGQERNTHRRSVWGLLHNLIEELASFDSRMLRTAWALMARPGELPLAFHEGRTRRYVPPVRLYLFVSLLFFLTLSVTGIALVQIELKEVPNAYTVQAGSAGDIVITGRDGNTKTIPADKAKEAMKDGGPSSYSARSLSPGVHSSVAPDIHFFKRVDPSQHYFSPAVWAQLESVKAQILKSVGNDEHGWIVRNGIASVEKLARDPTALDGPLTTWIPRVFFLLLPLYALLLALFYVRQRKQYFFVDHLVFSLVVHSFLFAILIVAVGAAQLLSGGLVALLIFLAMSAYIFLALKRFYKQGWFITSVKFACISFIYTVVFLCPALIAALVTGILEG